ncbi:MAG: TlpA family protein disulfide reductase [Ignavibacteriaceae bacterium]
MKYIILFLGIISFSCGNNEKQAQEENPNNNIEVITEKELQQIIVERNGKTLFLNVWATWCVPCVEEFPAIVELDENYKDKNVEVIALSVDLPSEIKDKVIPFLKEQNAGFKVYVAADKSADEIINMLNPEWSGAVPATFVFDMKGNQQKFLPGAHSYDQMSAVVDSINSLY